MIVALPSPPSPPTPLTGQRLSFFSFSILPSFLFLLPSTRKKLFSQNESHKSRSIYASWAFLEKFRRSLIRIFFFFFITSLGGKKLNIDSTVFPPDLKEKFSFCWVKNRLILFIPPPSLFLSKMKPNWSKN